MLGIFSWLRLLGASAGVAFCVFKYIAPNAPQQQMHDFFQHFMPHNIEFVDVDFSSLIQPTGDQGWYDPAWSYRLPITVLSASVETGVTASQAH